jgi:pyridoxal phosphate-dependent aminotransferase EpsN
MDDRVKLSIPHMCGKELSFVEQAFTTNWVAPLGPNVTAFEEAVEKYVGVKKAVAMSSGTAAIHIALDLLGVQPGDRVFVSSLTFVASVNPVLYQRATPVFIDSEPNQWNMCPEALRLALQTYEKKGQLPKAVIVVDLFGMPADYEALEEVCGQYQIPLVSDAAESLGSSFQGKKCGSLGRFSALSFNGNKIITTGGGGMLLGNDETLMEKALFLITQARDPALHYQHSQMGYNYRMSNVLAGVGRGQMTVLDQRVQRRREIFQIYKKNLEGWGLIFNPEKPEDRSNRWLTAAHFGKGDNRTGEDLCRYLNEKNIEARPIWKPMHLQPLFKDCDFFSTQDPDSAFADFIFEKGLCLPSATNYTDDVFDRVCETITQWSP